MHLIDPSELARPFFERRHQTGPYIRRGIGNRLAEEELNSLQLSPRDPR